MEIKSQAPGGPEWRGDVCQLDQQPVGSPVFPQCSPGLPPVPGTASPLCYSGFYFIVLTPLNLHSYL